MGDNVSDQMQELCLFREDFYVCLHPRHAISVWYHMVWLVSCMHKVHLWLATKKKKQTKKRKWMIPLKWAVCMYIYQCMLTGFCSVTKRKNILTRRVKKSEKKPCFILQSITISVASMCCLVQKNLSLYIQDFVHKLQILILFYSFCIYFCAVGI